MNALIHMLRDEFTRVYTGPREAEDVESFVRAAFARRNILPSDALVEQVVSHLLQGTPVAPLKSPTIRHCGQ